MSDESELPSLQELMKLPKGSISVFAIRCALRVQPWLAFYDKPTEEFKKAVVRLNSAFIDLASDVYDTDAFARAAPPAKVATVIPDDYTISYGGSHGIAVTAADTVAMAIDAVATGTITDTVGAATAAMRAATSSRDACGRITRSAARDAKAAAREDYAQLKKIRAEVIDASETGPLGDLWYGSPSDWYLQVKPDYDKTIVEWEREIAEEERNELAKQIEESTPEPLISAYFDSGFTKEEIATCLNFISESYRSIGGLGLKIVEGNEFIRKTAEALK